MLNRRRDRINPQLEAKLFPFLHPNNLVFILPVRTTSIPETERLGIEQEFVYAAFDVYGRSFGYFINIRHAYQEGAMMGCVVQWAH